jgi:hypothetical protein
MTNGVLIDGWIVAGVIKTPGHRWPVFAARGKSDRDAAPAARFRV